MVLVNEDILTYLLTFLLTYLLTYSYKQVYVCKRSDPHQNSAIPDVTLRTLEDFNFPQRWPK